MSAQACKHLQAGRAHMQAAELVVSQASNRGHPPGIDIEPICRVAAGRSASLCFRRRPFPAARFCARGRCEWPRRRRAATAYAQGPLGRGHTASLFAVASVLTARQSAACWQALAISPIARCITIIITAGSSAIWGGSGARRLPHALLARAARLCGFDRPATPAAGDVNVAAISRTTRCRCDSAPCMVRVGDSRRSACPGAILNAGFPAIVQLLCPLNRPKSPCVVQVEPAERAGHGSPPTASADNTRTEGRRTNGHRGPTEKRGR
eukprot:149994-Chlamydomonas_euryale.AAC.2